MNCKDYKEAIAADPSKSFDGASHAVTCASCTIYGDDITSLDLKIAKALSIPVPALFVPELPAIAEEDDNVVRLPLRHRGRASIPAWLGLAASVLVVTVLGVRFMSGGETGLTLANEIVAHLDHEPRALRITNQPVSAQRFTNVIQKDVAEMDEELGLFTYANICVINGRKIPHLVLQGERGPITLLLLPDEMIESAISLDGDGISGVILPVGKGSIAIIGERDEVLDEVEYRIKNSVKWRT